MCKPFYTENSFCNESKDSWAFNAKKYKGQRKCEERKTEKVVWVRLYNVCCSNKGNSWWLRYQALVSHHVLWQCQTLAPTDLFIDTGRAAQSLNPDSVQRGIRGDWKTQRPCSDAHQNKLVYKNTPVEDTSTNVEEWDTDHSMADRELSKNTLDNHSTTAKCLSHSLNLDKLLKMLQSQAHET